MRNPTPAAVATASESTPIFAGKPHWPMADLVADLNDHPTLQEVFGVPVSRALAVVADRNDLRIEAIVPMNDEEAAKYYRQSAEQGFVQAMSALAYVTYRGIGVEEDLVAGYMWYHVAAELGDFSAISHRDDLAGKLTQDDIANARADAAKWLEKFDGKTLHAGRISH